MLKYLWPALVWALIVLFLSAHPQMGIVRADWTLEPDKLAHACAYALLVFLLHYGFKNAKWPILIGTIYGVMIEWMQQAFFQGRHLDVLDMVANLVGCLLGIWFFPRFAFLLPIPRK